MKLDLSKKYKSYYSAKAKPEIIVVEAAQYISIEGIGDPSGADFAKDIQALYPVAYAIKFMAKAMDKDFTVPKLEGQWWYDMTQYANIAMEDAPTQIPRSEWMYRLLIRMPEYITETQVKDSIKTVIEKKKAEHADRVKWYEMNEGRCVQMLHVGPFDKEPETLAEIKSYCHVNFLEQNGLHHEIYLSDFRKTEPAKLRTILREPVK